MREIKKGDKYLCKTSSYAYNYFVKGNIYEVKLINNETVILLTDSGLAYSLDVNSLNRDFTDLQESKSEIATPKHYQTNSIDVIDFCKLYNLIEDLKKVIDYAQREIKHLETLNNK